MAGSLSDSNNTDPNDNSVVTLQDGDSDNGYRVAVERIGNKNRLLTAPTGQGDIGNLVILNAKNAGSADLLVDGSTTAVDFEILADGSDDITINELRFYSGGNGIKFSQFLSQNVALTNGIRIQITSQAVTVTLPLIFTTEDFKNKFAFGSGASFVLQKQTGADQILAVFLEPILLEGGTSDKIQVRIQDDLTTGGITGFEFLGIGFK